MGERQPLLKQIDPWVFWPTAALSLGCVLWGVIDHESLGRVTGDGLEWVIRNFGWVFVLSTFSFLVLAVYLGLSRHGKIRLGRDDERPEFRTTSWVAMMFSAGMGIGLMFFGVTEPLSHLATPPNDAARANSPEAASVAMEYSYFHWAFHPWALYAIVGLSLAYFVYRKGQRNLISTAFRPILGDRVDGPVGRTIDSLALFATLFGSATSLGLGALQINGNMVLAGILLLFLLVAGPTVFIFDMLTEAVGGYVTSIVPNSFRTGAFGDREWLGAWTIFYWAWWISWAPFVGTFIARISRGRTIGQFVLGADAASVVMGMLCSRGSLEPNRLVVIVFGVLTGAAAAVLLVAGGLQG